MRRATVVFANREVLLQRWQRHLAARSHLHFQELLHLLRQPVGLLSLSRIDFHQREI